MKTINFNNHKFQISRDGILYWFDKQIAIISDLHLEKGSSFGPSGQFLPPYDSEETLTKLLNTLSNYNITKVILLGDTFHDKNALSRMSNKVLILFETFIKKYEPKHLLLEVARDDSYRGLIDLDRLSDFLKRIENNITFKRLDRISPLAVPLILEINRQTIDKSEMEEYLLEELENEILSEVGLN